MVVRPTLDYVAAIVRIVLSRFPWAGVHALEAMVTGRVVTVQKDFRGPRKMPSTVSSTHDHQCSTASCLFLPVSRSLYP